MLPKTHLQHLGQELEVECREVEDDEATRQLLDVAEGQVAGLQVAGQQVEREGEEKRILTPELWYWSLKGETCCLVPLGRGGDAWLTGGRG